MARGVVNFNTIAVTCPMQKLHLVRYFAKNLATVTGIVLIWRGVWIAMDGLDKFLFNSSPFPSAFVGIIVGLLLLYLPDGDLKELEKL